MARYAAKLLFDWNPDPITRGRVMRISEERIVVFAARSARASLVKAKRLGREAELRYDSGHRLRFVGILQLTELGVECAEGEVWWELRRRRCAKERAKALLPPARDLWVFRDLTSGHVGRRVSRARPNRPLERAGMNPRGDVTSSGAGRSAPGRSAHERMNHHRAVAIGFGRSECPAELAVGQ